MFTHLDCYDVVTGKETAHDTARRFDTSQFDQHSEYHVVSLPSQERN